MVGVSPALGSQNNAPAQQEPQRPTSNPYTGDLSIFEYPDRDKKLQIDRVMKLLKIAPGKAVADIGAGSGWFTVRAAKKVAPGGIVFAEDINPDATKYIDEQFVELSAEDIKKITCENAAKFYNLTN